MDFRHVAGTGLSLLGLADSVDLNTMQCGNVGSGVDAKLYWYLE